jgi:hypothetical protein
VANVLQNDLVSEKNIRFSTNKISFAGKSNQKKLVAMVVEVEHK